MLFPWRLLSSSASASTKSFPNPNPRFYSLPPSSSAVLSLFNCKRRKKLKKKLTSPRVQPIQSSPSLSLPGLDSLLHRDSHFRFLSRAKSFLSRQPSRRLPLPDAGKLHRQLGFPRGRKVSASVSRHPLLFTISAPPGERNPSLAFTPLMESLLEEEESMVDSVIDRRVTAVRKLVMMSATRRIPLAKLHHCRAVFGLPEDFRDRARDYPEFFKVVVDPADGRHVLELTEWDPKLAVSALEQDFVTDEDRVRKTFKFPIPHGKSLPLDEDDERKMNSLSTLPLISPYSDGSNLKLWSVEAEKYRVGVIHEFLSLTLEKRAMIQHIVEFKEEFSLTRHTYQMLLKQPRAFYLAGTEMNWGVFLRDAYTEDGSLIEKDPQVVFDEKLRKYALMKEGDLDQGERNVVRKM